ncbi:MAG: CBS domain-containing protein [Bacteroidales bacterium]|nr:CBS domain-containing protein [Bacteroidales bacterium]
MEIINILFFLTPKAEVAYLEENYSLRQVLEKMEYHKYSSIPILNSEGEYLGTLSEGDLLWYFRHNDMVGIKWQELLHLTDVPRRFDYEPVNASSNIEDLLSKIIQQNFVPVVDDCDKFIGIITRRDVIQYYGDHT